MHFMAAMIRSIAKTILIEPMSWLKLACCYTFWNVVFCYLFGQSSMPLRNGTSCIKHPVNEHIHPSSIDFPDVRYFKFEEWTIFTIRCAFKQAVTALIGSPVSRQQILDAKLFFLAKMWNETYLEKSAFHLTALIRTTQTHTRKLTPCSCSHIHLGMVYWKGQCCEFSLIILLNKLFS